MKRVLFILVTVILAGAGLATALMDEPVQKAPEATTTATAADAGTSAHPRCDAAAKTGCQKRAASSACCKKASSAAGDQDRTCTKGGHHGQKRCCGHAGSTTATSHGTAAKCPGSSTKAGPHHGCPHRAGTTSSAPSAPQPPASPSKSQ